MNNSYMPILYFMCSELKLSFFLGVGVEFWGDMSESGHRLIWFCGQQSLLVCSLVYQMSARDQTVAIYMHGRQLNPCTNSLPK